MTGLRPACTLALACLMAPLLASCGDSADMPEAAESEEPFDGIRAGKWDIRSRVASIDMNRDDAVSAERAEELMREERAAQQCLDYSERSKPPVTFLYAGTEACTYTSFTMAGGRIRAILACAGDGAEPTRMSGSYDKASFNVTVSKLSTGDDGRTLERSYSTSGRHKGNC